MRRNSPLAPGRRKARPKVPDDVRAAVKDRTDGLCHLCLHELGYVVPVVGGAASGPARRLRERRGARRIVHLHHVLPVQSFPDLTAEPWNLLGLCLDHHFRHEGAARSGTQRIPRAALPPETLALADDDGPRAVYIERTYPLTDAGRFPA